MDDVTRTNKSQPFKDSLIQLANKLRTEIGLAKTSDVEDALALVLTHIVVGALSGSGYTPLPRRLDNNEAIIGAVFLCFVSSSTIVFLQQEGIKLPITDVTVRASLAIFQFFQNQAKEEITSRGMERYKVVIAAGKDRKDIREFSDSVNQLVYLYVTSGDEECIKNFSNLYMALINGKERNQGGE